MKPILSLIVCITMSIAVIAQTNYNTVTINLKGQNQRIIIDGKEYSPTSNLTIQTNQLAPGRHTIQVIRNNRRATETTFTLRRNYDIAITVAGNGSMQTRETYRISNGNSSSTGVVPMSTERYNALTQEIRNTTQIGGKINLINSAFNNTANYFTTNQARRLVLLVNGEAYRLQLAKAAVRGITDVRNIYSLTNVLTSQNGRNELNDYIRSYTNSQSTGSTPPVNTAMSDANFSVLFNDIRNRWQPGAKMAAVSSAFSSSYFTTAQAGQLIQLLSSEGERLQLAKAAYPRIVDQANFNQIYNLLGTQASRDELASHIRTSTGSNTGSYPTNTGNVKTPMSEANFSSLVEQVRNLWLPGAKKREILNQFANANNYFTSNQIVQLVQLDNDEADRMDMVKASLRLITDPQNATVLYNLFPSQARKDELSAYIRSYNSSTGVSDINTTTSGTYRTAMSESNFNALLEQTKSLWLPGAKKSAVLNAFSTPNTYFTTNQAIQLIQLDNDEDDRLDMAKAAYKSLTDPQNYTRINSLFTNQAYINDLAAYVRSVQ